MRLLLPLSAALALGACATAGESSMPDRSTTTISMAAHGDEGSLGTGTTSVTTSAAAGPARMKIGASPDQVWNALHAVYTDLGIPVETIDLQNRRLGNVAFVQRRQLGGQPLSRYFDCGTNAFGAARADSERIQLHVTSHVAADGTDSEVTTDVRATALSGAASGTAVNCRSRGSLEAAIENRLRRLIPG
jgi:hypothetical protein